MKYTPLILAFLVAACQLGFDQVQASVSFDDLIQAPQRFDGKIVTVRGLLAFENQPRHAPLAILYSGEEDAKSRLTKDAVLVIPSDKMIASQTRVAGRFVSLTGTFRAVQGPDGSLSRVIKDIREFVWSEPHPSTD